MKPTNLSYGELLTISKNLCKSFYESETRMFGPAVKSRDDEKRVIFSILKFSIRENEYSYDPKELMNAVSVCVDEANIKKYSSHPPPPPKV